MGDGEIRKALGPQAVVSQLRAQARAAGKDAYSDARAAYVRQFHGRRPSYEEACEADPMEGAEAAFEAWAYSSGTLAAHACAHRTPRLWGQLLAEFASGWDAAA